MSLFDPGPVDPGKLDADAVKQLSDDQRRTIRANGLIAGGTHPVTLRPLANNDHTCGDCGHHVIDSGHARSYHKCELRMTGGAGTDVRLRWPACTGWIPERSDP